jgi:hypothetical protein
MKAPSLSFALRYASEFNFAVFPCVHRSKVPATICGFKDASRDPAKISAMWANRLDANLGIACGAFSDGLLVLDVDGPEGENSLLEFERENGPLPKTPQVLTGKGRQFYFRANHSFQSKVGIAPGIDIRATGGYVIAPPSIHPNGKPYLWAGGSDIQEVERSEAPVWLVNLCKKNDKLKSNQNEVFWRSLSTNLITEGSRNSSLAKIAGHLLRRNVNVALAMELLKAFNRSHFSPPLPLQELIQVANSVAGLELKRRGRLNDVGPNHG